MSLISGITEHFNLGIFWQCIRVALKCNFFHIITDNIPPEMKIVNMLIPIKICINILQQTTAFFVT